MATDAEIILFTAGPAISTDSTPYPTRRPVPLVGSSSWQALVRLYVRRSRYEGGRGDRLFGTIGATWFPCQLQGLDPEACYEITEPMPNNVSQNSSNLRIVETMPGFQLQHPSVILTGAILMNAGLPLKFYTLDDSLRFW